MSDARPSPNADPRQPDSPHSLWRDRGLWSLMLIFLLAYGVNFRANLIGDSQSHLYQAASLAWSGNLELSEYRARLLDAGGGELPYFVKEDQRGRIRSVYTFLPALTLAPAFLICGWILGEGFRESTMAWGLVGKTIASLMILGAGLALWALLRRRVARGVALLSVAALWFGSPLWPTSEDFMQHQPLALFECMALLAIFGARPGRPPCFFLGGALLGLAMACRYQSVVVVGAIAGVVLWIWQDDARLPRFVWGGLGMSLATFVLHAATVGSFFGVAPTPFGPPGLPTLAGLLVSPGAGMWFYSPWTALAFAAPLILFTRRKAPGDRRLFVACAVAVLPILLMLSWYRGWYGGWTWGWRLALDAAPALVVLFAFGADAIWRRRAARAMTAALTGLAIAIQTLGALTWDSQWHAIHDLGYGGLPAWQWQWRNSPVLFYARRGRLYLGTKPISLWENPYESQGLYESEAWDGGILAAWTRREARFVVVAKSQEPALLLYAPTGEGVAAPLGVTVRIGAAQQQHELAPGEWNEIPMPGIAPQHSAVVEMEFDKTWRDPAPPGRELGAAIVLETDSIRAIGR